MFSSIFGTIETYAFLALSYFDKNPLEETKTRSAFISALGLQFINIDNTYSAVPLLDLPQTQPLTRLEQHILVAVSTNDEKPRVQRKCIISSRDHYKEVKNSYFCKKCGPKAVLCCPRTGSVCYVAHRQ